MFDYDEEYCARQALTMLRAGVIQCAEEAGMRCYEQLLTQTEHERDEARGRLTWRRLSEQRPNPAHHLVLAYFPQIKVTLIVFDAGSFWHRLDGSLICDPNLPSRPTIEPSHWMPLPDPPK